MIVRGFTKIVVETALGWQRHRTGQMAAQLALYLGFAILSMLLIGIFVAGAIYADPAYHTPIDTQLLKLTGPQTAATVRAGLRAAHTNHAGPAVAAAACLYVLFLAAGITLQLQGALNVIWDKEQPDAKAVRKQLRARVGPFLAIFVLALLLIVVLFVGGALHAVNTYTSRLPDTDAHVFQVLNVLATMVLLAVLFVVIYGYLPRSPIPWPLVAISAVIAAVLFERGQFFFALYLGKMNIRSPYADAGAFLDLWLWVYYSAEVVLIGAEFARVLQRRSERLNGANAPQARVQEPA